MTLGEFEKIALMAGILPQPGASVETGIGDDCAVLKMGGSRILVTTDAFVEGVHFPGIVSGPAVGSSVDGTPEVQGFDAERLGFRSIVATISDVAAMGGRCLWLVVSVALPAHFSDERLSQLYEGVARACRSFQCDLVGGDTTRSPGPLVVSVTGIGTMQEPTLAPVLRSGARAGDIIAVTGTLGDAAAGLAVLQGRLRVPASPPPSSGKRVASPRTPQDVPPGIAPFLSPELSEHERFLVSRFWEPIPRTEEALLLAASGAVHAMIDISDGLGQDLGHIARLSRLKAVVDLSLLPRSPALAAVEATDPKRAQEWLAGGGEEYELLAAIAPDMFDAVAQALAAAGLAPLRAIGRFEPGEGVWLTDGRRIDRLGWDHFKTAG